MNATYRFRAAKKRFFLPFFFSSGVIFRNATELVDVKLTIGVVVFGWV
jgi:hypothetical protein